MNLTLFSERHHLNPGWMFLLASKNFLAASLPDAAMEFKATWSWSVVWMTGAAAADGLGTHLFHSPDHSHFWVLSPLDARPALASAMVRDSYSSSSSGSLFE